MRSILLWLKKPVSAWSLRKSWKLQSKYTYWVFRIPWTTDSGWISLLQMKIKEQYNPVLKVKAKTGLQEMSKYIVNHNWT